MKIPRLTAAQKEIARDALRDLRVAIGAHTSDADAREIVLDWLITTTDRLAPGGRTEAAALVRYLLTEINTAGDATSQQLPSPAPVTAGAPGVNDPVLYLPMTCGWYNSADQVMPTLDWVADQARAHGIVGRLGVCMETSGSTGNLGVQTADWSAAYQAHAEALLIVVTLAADRHIPCKVDGHNSNDPGKGWAKSWGKPHGSSRLLELVTAAAGRLAAAGPWMIYQGSSENDSATPNRDALRKAVASNIQASLRAEPDRAAGAWYDEEHLSGVVSRIDDDRRTLYTTDNGDGIRAHFQGGVWDAHKPRRDACIRTAQAILGRGCKLALYHRAPALHILDHAEDYALIIEAVAPLLRGASAPAPDVPPADRLTFSAGKASRYVRWTPAVDRTGWGEGSEQGCDGLLYGCKVGGTPRKIEHIKVGKQETGTKNAYEDRKDPKYNQGWKAGDRVLLQVRDAFGKLRSPTHQGEWTLR